MKAFISIRLFVLSALLISAVYNVNPVYADDGVAPESQAPEVVETQS
jgi:hypothetical protein